MWRLEEVCAYEFTWFALRMDSEMEEFWAI